MWTAWEASGADLAIIGLTATPTGTVGSNLVYGLTIINNGPLDAPNVTVNDFLPAGVTLAGVIPSQFTSRPRSASDSCS